MCRMIIAIGEIEAKNLISDLVLMAQGLNTVHERNMNLGEFKHENGWGISYLDIKTNIWYTYKSLKPIYNDEKVHDFINLRTKAIVLHARKATKGEVSLENTQPINYHSNKGDFFFVHNGTIQDISMSEKHDVQGNSDTVQWFNKLLNKFNEKDEIFKDEIYSFDNYTGANFFLVTPKKIFIGQSYKKFPKYYSMKMLNENGNIIVSSEIPNTMKNRDWKDLDNGSILELDLKPKSIA